MKTLNSDDLVIIMEALDLYTSTKKEVKKDLKEAMVGEMAMSLLHKDIMQSIRLRGLFTEVWGQLWADKTEALSIDITARLKEA